jgi:MFS family permease
VVATGDPGDDLRGKNLVAMTIAAPILLASSTLLAVFSGGWILVPVAVGVGFGAVLTALGVGNIVSVLAPLPVAGEGENYFAQRNTGQGCATGLVIAVAMLVLVTLWLPLAGAVVASWFFWKPGLALCVPFALMWGETCRRVGLRTASRDLLRRQPEVLRAIGAEAVG